MIFATKQSTTSFPLYWIWFATQSPCIRHSCTAVSVGSQRSLLQFDGECTANPRRLLYNSAETALRIEKFLNGLKNLCSLATPLRMRWESIWMRWESIWMRWACAESALRLRGDSENWQKFNSLWSCSQSCQSVRAAFGYLFDADVWFLNWLQNNEYILSLKTVSAFWHTRSKSAANIFHLKGLLRAKK